MRKEEGTLTVDMRVLKMETCPSLSGQSELRYQIGCNAGCDIYIKLVANSGSGKFNAEWIALSVLEKCLSARQSKTVRTGQLRPLFPGKSTNTPSFLLAVLVSEGIVLPKPDRDAAYPLGDVAGFRDAMTALATSPIEAAPPDATPSSPSKRKAKGKG